MKLIRSKHKQQISKKTSKTHKRTRILSRRHPRLQMQIPNSDSGVIGTKREHVFENSDSEKDIQLPTSMESDIIHTVFSLDGWKKVQKKKGKKDNSNVSGNVSLRSLTWPRPALAGRALIWNSTAYTM